MDTFLSVCMIVKDEEKVLERCLESIQKVADEIVIVDTGSIDKTKEIAFQFTNKVYEFEWINDFSKARNYAASKATGEWIFVLDADEYVDKESFSKFKNELMNYNHQYNILAPQIVSFVGDDAGQTVLNYHERIYRNNGKIEYRRAVHEVLTHKENQAKIYKVDFNIYHSGYMAETVKEKNKRERNLSILVNNKNKEAIDYFYLGNEYAAHGNRSKAIDFYKKAFNKQTNHQVEWDKKLLINMVSCLHKEKRNQEALSIAQAGNEKYPEYADFIYYQALIYYEIGEKEKARALFEKILLRKEQLKVDASLEILELLPLHYLSMLYEEVDIQKSVKYYSKVISLTENNNAQWSRLLYLIGKNSTLDQLTTFINKNLATSKNMSEIKLAKILLNVPLLNVQKLSRSLLENSALSEIQKDALLIKNHLLDYHFEEVYMMLEEWTDERIIELLHTKIFSIQDFTLFTLLIEYERGIKLLSTLKFDQSTTNFINLLFKNGKRDLNENEENLFIQIYSQSLVFGIKEVVEIMNEKVFALSDEKRFKLKELNQGKY